MRRRKKTTVWAYLDGKKLADVVEDVKKLLIKENPGHEVTFKTE